MSYRDIEILKDSIEFGKDFLQFWKSLQPAWQFRESTTIKNTEGALFNDHKFLPKNESWQQLLVSRSHGILLALVGVAMWAISTKQDKRRGMGEELTKTIKDINVVLRMMSQHVLNERENLIEKTLKHQEEWSDKERFERNAKRPRTRKRVDGN